MSFRALGTVGLGDDGAVAVGTDGFSIVEAPTGADVNLAATAVGKGSTTATLDEPEAFADANPDGDISNDGWFDETGGDTDVHDSIDEDSPDDADFVKAPLTDEPIIMVSWTPS